MRSLLINDSLASLVTAKTISQQRLVWLYGIVWYGITAWYGMDNILTNFNRLAKGAERSKWTKLCLDLTEKYDDDGVHTYIHAYIHTYIYTYIGC